MEEEIETFSEKTLSGDELNFNQIEPEVEWINYITPDESASQITCDTELTNSEIDFSTITGSTVWLYFDKNLPHASGHNVCKKCNKKFSMNTGITTLRGHLKTHQLKVLTKKQSQQNKRILLRKMNKINMMNTLFSGLFVISNHSQLLITIILENF